MIRKKSLRAVELLGSFEVYVAATFVQFDFCQRGSLSRDM